MKLAETKIEDLLIKSFELTDINQSYIKWLNNKKLLKYSINKLKIQKEDCFIFLKVLLNLIIFFCLLKIKILAYCNDYLLFFNHNKICDIEILVGNEKY